MITFRITTEVKDDRRVVLTMPPEVPTGQADLVVSVDSASVEEMSTPSGIADCVEVQVQRNGEQKTRYPLRGSVIRYERPTEPAAETDWEALR